MPKNASTVPPGPWEVGRGPSWARGPASTLSPTFPPPPKYLLAELLSLNPLFFFFIIIIFLIFIVLKAAHSIHCDEVILILAGYFLLEHLQLPRGAGLGSGQLWALEVPHVIHPTPLGVPIPAVR